MKNEKSEAINEYILLVDDTVENLRVLGGLLKDNGYKVAVARSAAEAVEAIEHELPILILLDVMMPSVDGYEFCLQLKQQTRYAQIPVIFITAKNDTEDLLHGFEVGGVDYVTKPFNSAELLARVKVHVELQQAKQIIKMQSIELQKINAAKDRIFSIISHDLRTPISSLLQLIYFCEEEEDFDYEIFSSTMQDVEKSVNETLSTLDNLLHWSRSQMQNIQTQPSVCDLLLLFKSTTTLLASVLNKKNIQIQYSNSNFPTVWADAEMLKIVFRNLLSNAIKFTNPNTIITINVIQKETNCIISIADQGIGLKEDVLSKIFSENQYHTQPGTKGESGTGLGIKICKQFIELNKGELGAYNNQTEGSTFWFSLPMIV